MLTNAERNFNELIADISGLRLSNMKLLEVNFPARSFIIFSLVFF